MPRSEFVRCAARAEHTADQTEQKAAHRMGARPSVTMEAPTGIEPVIAVLQTAPLATWVRRRQA